MRGVAWTDALQAVLMLGGLAGLLLAAVPTPAHLAAAVQRVAELAPSKVAVPSQSDCLTWAITILLIGLSGSAYPQAIQRIFAARDLAALKRSLTLMAFMPIFTMTPLVLTGILAVTTIPGLEGVAADQVMPRLLDAWASGSAGLAVAAWMVLVAVLAAIMSTADSVLLSLSSILAKDVLGRTLLASASERQVTRIGKSLSWAIVAGLVALALVPRITRWGLIEIKMEVLAQVWPMLCLGLRWERLTASAALAGLLAGLGVSGILAAAGHSRLAGIHAGVIGLGVNVSVAIAGTLLLSQRPPRRPSSR